MHQVTSLRYKQLPPCLVSQVLYVSADDLDTLTKLEKGSRAGSAASVAAFSCQGGCKRRKLIDYFGQKR